jgi:hypothetical protein
MPRIAFLLALLGLLPAALTGCMGGDENNEDRGQLPAAQSGGEDAENAGGGAPAQGIMEINISADGADPDPATVQVGQQLLFRNTTDEPIRITAGDTFSADEVPAGGEFEWSPDGEDAGTVEYEVTGGSTAKGSLEIAD